MNYRNLFAELKIPLAQTSKVFVNIFSIIADSFQHLQEYYHQWLYSHFIQSKKSLVSFSKDRGIVRIYNEKEDNYYNRVLNAYSFMKNSSTKKGIVDLLMNFTTKSFEIREIYQDDFILDSEHEKLEETTFISDDSSNYYFIVHFNVPLTVSENEYLKEIIDLYKPAHIGYHIDAIILDDFILDDEKEKLEYNTYLEE